MYGPWGLFPIVVAGCSLVAIGCGDVSLEFSPRRETANLIEPARDSVNNVLDTSFGSPAKSVAWEKLPIEFHGARAEAIVVDEEKPTELELDLEYQTEPIEAGQTVAWVRGENVAAVRRVVDWNSDQGVLTVDEPLPFEVDGDLISIDPGAHLKFGRRVYAQHCQHCHGVGGDGNGPTAWSMNPKPRDFRLGEFKFTSTQAGRKASRDDLVRTLDHGIPGTYMPSFKLLGDEQTRAVVEYVRWLSMRGELEKELVTVLELDFSNEVAADYDDPAELSEEFLEYAEEDFAYDVEDAAIFMVEKWDAGESSSAVVTPSTPRPAANAESVARGRALYLASATKCAGCHGESGIGVTQDTLKYQADPDGGYLAERGYYDSWGNPIQPRNLLTGVFRGGRRPIDVFRRLHAGIKGTPMPGFGTSLTEEQIWDLVNYILALPEDPLAGQGVAEPIGSSTATDEVPAIGSKKR